MHFPSVVYEEGGGGGGGGGAGAVVRASDFGPMGTSFEHRPGAVRCGLEEVTFTPCLVLVKPRKRKTNDRHGQTRPDNMDETVPHAYDEISSVKAVNVFIYRMPKLNSWLP